MLSDRNRRDRQDRQGYIIIGCCVVALAAAGTAFALNQPPARDRVTGCLKSTTALHDITIVDRTDPWSATARALLRTALSSLADNAAPETRVTLVPFDGAADVVPHALFDKCRPVDGRGVNSLFSTPAKADKLFQTSFVAPLSTTIDQLTVVGNAANTNLVDFLSAAAGTLSAAPATRRRLRIYSDMAEHTGEGSFITGKQRFDAASFTRYFREHGGDRLKAIDLEIIVTPSAATPAAVARNIKASWTAALSASGVTFTWGQL